MEVKVVDKNDFSLRLIIDGVDSAFMNSLRRIMLSEVPSMAVDEVVVIENSSMVHDEILAHRLGLIPLRTDLDSYNLPEECSCKSELGCNLCRASLTLDVEAKDTIRTVYSGDLVAENPNIRPVSEKIPIAKLAPNQRLKLEAYARLGKGEKHAKWQPVSVCAYKHFPKLKIDEKNCDSCGRCVDICPKRVLSISEGGKKLELRKIVDCTVCKDCVDVCPKSPPAIEVSWDKDVFVFDVESSGALPVERVISEAVKILDRKFESFLEQLAVKKDEARQVAES
ncbi:MAG: DNA-directed RNA polymerase subunit D [Candidatus Bathyarchaeota archaeon]|nr:DNA-directed RNA polymerase subunit D [Candidatus Bathyarchaeota archaeon]